EQDDDRDQRVENRKQFKRNEQPRPEALGRQRKGRQSVIPSPKRIDDQKGGGRYPEQDAVSGAPRIQQPRQHQQPDQDSDVDGQDRTVVASARKHHDPFSPVNGFHPVSASTAHAVAP